MALLPPATSATYMCEAACLPACLPAWLPGRLPGRRAWSDPRPRVPASKKNTEPPRFISVFASDLSGNGCFDRFGLADLGSDVWLM